MTITREDLARKTRRLHRKRFWQTVRYRVARVWMRPLCVAREHGHWERETTLLALTSGHSRRCQWCNRLVLKPEFRVDQGWTRTTRGWVWSRG